VGAKAIGSPGLERAIGLVEGHDLRPGQAESLAHRAAQLRGAPELADHDYFYRSENGVDRVHIHVSPTGGRWERRHLAFCAYLRSHPEVAADYERLKQDLAARYPDNVFRYVVAAKGD
jgi:GrpB-like predicted nucleotidyltransferase (UPF0157 family)